MSGKGLSFPKKKKKKYFFFPEINELYERLRVVSNFQLGFFFIKRNISWVNVVCDRTVEEYKKGHVDAEKILNIPYLFNTPEGGCNFN